MDGHGWNDKRFLFFPSLSFLLGNVVNVGNVARVIHEGWDRRYLHREKRGIKPSSLLPTLSPSFPPVLLGLLFNTMAHTVESLAYLFSNLVVIHIYMRSGYQGL